MGEFKVDFADAKLKDEVAMPENVSPRIWAAIIKYADHFLGCDSVGQHLAFTTKTPATVLCGSTFPINVSYPNEPTINILDMGEEIREYSPIRITQDERIDRKNENIMSMSPEIHDYIIDAILGKHTDDK